MSEQSDGKRFKDFMEAMDRALRILGETGAPIEDIEIGVRTGAESSWMLYGAREIQNCDEFMPKYRMGSGDVMVSFRAGKPLVTFVLGRIRVDVEPRG